MEVGTEDEDEGVVTVRLVAPIEVRAEQVTEVQITEPTAEIIAGCKRMPFDIDADERMIVNTSVLPAYLTRCAKIPRSSVMQMKPADLFACGMALASFFTPPGSGDEDEASPAN